ncbi:invasin domain 3-containing protein [Paenibacillus chibensis]|uniref:Invasin domain 3-containing protein n=1 Tax=Paenibacillus chibensis TaxID=59846 RepID=A0ABU6PZ15_9BACL|nr:invasin domain 3-containing protein [Paenibacillus chibensis]
MIGIQRNKRWMPIALVIALLFGTTNSYAFAADAALPDQEQTQQSGSIWLNKDRPLFQTFTPAVTGSLDRIDLYIAGVYGAAGAIQVQLYKEGDSTLLAQGQSVSEYPDVSWVAVDFSGARPYLKKGTMYRMVIFTENGDPFGLNAYWKGGNVYTRGYSDVASYDFAFRTYMIADYSISETESEILAASSLVADGIRQTPITVKLRDAQGNAITSGGETVEITSSLGTVGPVTDNGNGTYTAMLTAPTAAGTATISASFGGKALTKTAEVQLVAGDPSTGTSTVETAAATLPADGMSKTLVTVKLRDAYGNEVKSGGAAVAITSTSGTVSSVTNKGDGTYTAELTAPTETGTATVSASISGKPLASTARVQFVIGAPSAETSTIEAADATLPADGTSRTEITVRLRDAQDRALTKGGAFVAIRSTSGEVTEVRDNGDGTYTAKLTASTTVGPARVSAYVNERPLTKTASVQFVTGAPSMEKSTIEAADATLPADGTSRTEITVRLKDAQDRALTKGGEFVFIDSTLGEVTEVRDNEDGTYTAMLTAPVETGTATVSAFVNERPLTATASVEFLPGDVSASHSTLTASDLVVRADGSSKAVIQVTLKDDNDHLLAGKKVTLEASGGQSVIEAVSAVTDEKGIATFAVSNTAAENVTYTAKEEASGITVDQSVEIAFTYDQPPTIEVKLDPDTPTFEGVSVAATSTVYGQWNEVAVMKWAPGHQQVSYFDKEGTIFTDRFTVQENGFYSVYAADTAGNANVRVIEILNIVPKSSDNSLSGWQLTGVGGTLSFAFDPEKTSYSIPASSAVNGLRMLLTPTDSHAEIYVNGSEISSGAVTDVYSLATGNNMFEVRVVAQNGSVKTYKLQVVRSNPSPTPDSGGSSGSSGAGTASPQGAANPAKPENDDTLKARVNGTEIPGIARMAKDANGAEYIDIELKKDALKKVLDSLAAQKAVLTVSVETKADRTVLRVPGEVALLLNGKSAALILAAYQGQYRLPLAEIVKTDSVWPKDTELQLTLERAELKSLTGLQAAAGESGIRLMSDPIFIHVYEAHQGGKKEITRFNPYVERILYLPEASAGMASTVAAWDDKLGIRPVPTKFTTINGKLAAVVHTLTNNPLVLVSKPSGLTDLQGHWAAAEIRDMNSRLIIQGIDESRFAPEAAVTRAELAALLSRALGLPDGDGGPSQFRDVSSSSWYSGAVEAVYAYHMMDGLDNGSFAPNQKVSRQEAIVTVIRALQLAGDAPSDNDALEGVNLSAYSDGGEVAEWAKSAIATAIGQGLVKGYGSELRPQKLLTRAEMSVLLYRMLEQAGLINGK